MNKNEIALWALAARDLDATDEEKNALLDILDSEGFGGREDSVTTCDQAEEVLRERLEWLRGQREEGHR